MDDYFEDERPPRIEPRLVAAPKIRQFFWCDFPRDAQLPELWKRRPVIVLSPAAKRHGAVTVIGCTTKAQTDPRCSFPLRTTIDGRAAWAICDKPATVAVSRLVADKRHIVRMPKDEFHEMLRLVLECLPKLP